MLIATVVVLGLIAMGLGRRGMWLASAACWVFVGITLAGADSPVADLARTCANAVIRGGTAFVTTLGGSS